MAKLIGCWFDSPCGSFVSLLRSDSSRKDFTQYHSHTHYERRGPETTEADEKNSGNTAEKRNRKGYSESQ